VSELEILQRRELLARIDRACAALDLDGLRFVHVVALVRGMDSNELTKLEEAVMRVSAERAEKEATRG